MPPQRRGKSKNNLKYFTESAPEQWGLRAYLQRDHGEIPPREIIDNWKKSLVAISKDAGKTFGKKQRARAEVLLVKFNEKGPNSDRAWGREWIKNQERRDGVHIGAYIESNSGAYVAGGTVGSISVNSAAPEPSERRTTRRATRAASAAGKKAHKTDEEEREERETSDEEDEEPETADVIPSGLYPSFESTYKAMETAHKWHLSTGRYVEDIIFEKCMAMSPKVFKDCIARSFVLDLGNEEMRSWFTPSEWEEISSSTLPLPTPDEFLVNSTKRFWRAKTPSELRAGLRKPYIPDDIDHDRSLHSNAEWADSVFRRLTRLLEHPDRPLRASHMEDWYTSYVWSSVIDDCLLALDGVTIERKEAACRATQTRKNRNRSSTSLRPKTTNLHDGMIRTMEDNYLEYGVVEVARSFKGPHTTKNIRDTDKVARSLRDMLGRLVQERAKGDPRVVRKLQVVGVINAGLQLQGVRMNHPQGYVCLLIRDELRAFPNDAGFVMDAVKLCIYVAQLVQIVRETMAVLKGSEEKSDEEVLRELLGGRNTPEEKLPPLGWAADSP